MASLGAERAPGSQQMALQGTPCGRFRVPAKPEARPLTVGEGGPRRQQGRAIQGPRPAPASCSHWARRAGLRYIQRHLTRLWLKDSTSSLLWGADANSTGLRGL